MRILVLGCKGQLGRCLSDQFMHTSYDVVYASRIEIDISNFDATKNYILDISPNIIINASAYTAVDQAEEDYKTANLINHFAVSNIAEICKSLGSRLIHLSTDYVFDGCANVAYTENDKTNPQSVYGKTKLKGELAIKSSGCEYFIIRTAWVYSEYGNNFLKTMLELGTQRESLRIVGDQIGCPTYAQDIAKAIIKILPQSTSYKRNEIYHYCGSNRCSWHTFAELIFYEANINGFKTPKKVSSISTSAYPTPAVRPMFSVLDCNKIETEFSILASNLEDGIQSSIKKLKKMR